MRIGSILAAACLAALPASADTIYLRNGQSIAADRTQVTATRVEYERGENTFAIPRELVLRIDTAAAPAVAGMEAAEAIRPGGQLPGTTAPPQKLDGEQLRRIEAAGNARESAAAYFFAGREKADAGDLNTAVEHLQRAIHFLPESALLHEHLASLHLRMGRFAPALAAAEKATRLDERSADGFALLGLAYFQSDRTREAIRAWQRSLQIRPNHHVQTYLARAEREMRAEDGFREVASSHFNLRFEGSRTAEPLRRQVLATLESHYNKLVDMLGIAPRESITVVLHTNQGFFDVTRAPAWSAAINDGRIRLPVEGMESVTPEMSRVLLHELAHSFITQVSRGRAPQWLHEGMAQLLEPRSAAAYGPMLYELFRTQTHVQLARLDSEYARLSGREAAVAYAESLAAVEYIRDTFGLGELVRMLVNLGEGKSVEEALRVAARAGYAGFERDLAEYLRQRYGGVSGVR